MAGEAAIRRAGPTAANFQPPPSEADERRRSLSDESLLTYQSEASVPYSMRSDLSERESTISDVSVPYSMRRFIADRDTARPPIPYVTEQLVPQKSAEPFERGVGAGGGIPTAVSRPARGRPKKGTQQAVPLGGKSTYRRKP
jgi:hypothetical protein